MPIGKQALVNRYSVERVEADIMLGFFFPGAAMPDQAETDAAERAPAPDRRTGQTTPSAEPGPGSAA